MKALVLTVSALVSLFTMAGCKKIFPDGPAIKETRSVADFDRIVATFSGNVEYVQGQERKVEIEAAHNIQNYIITEVIGDKLVLKTKPNVTVKHGSVTVYVTNPTLTGVTLTGSGDFSAYSDINTPTMDLNLSGSGNVSIPQLTATSLKAVLTGSGNISVRGGGIHKQEVTITGNGDYSTSSMRSEEAKVTVTGSGDARLWAESKLEATITGSGSVWYTGTPVISTSISGSGKVRKM